MAITANSSITATDINAIISKINSEATARGVAGTVSTVTAGNVAAGTNVTSMITKNASLRTSHCYCQADGGIQTHSGGANVTMTAAAADFDAGDAMDDTATAKVNTDIDALVAQCDCNSYGCTCHTNATYSCTCESVCTCDFNCGCDGDKITCPSNQVFGCTCNTVCSCNINCTCHLVCACEFGG